jgi:histidinol-phosphatase
MNPEWQSRYEVMREAARQAGDLALGYFDTGIPVEMKTDFSPVTLADREAEKLLRQTITSYFPNDAFLGEEFGEQEGRSGFRWIIDPIDGTRSFIRNIPIWATLVGLEYDGRQIGGVAYVPCWKQMFHALQGGGAFRDDRRISVSQTANLKQSLVSYSSFGFFKASNKGAAFQEMLNRCERSRAYADFYGFVLVAQGSVDLMVEYGVHTWDVAGLKVIVEEAGGRFSDWDGNPVIDRPDALATNGKVHEAALEILRR